MDFKHPLELDKLADEYQKLSLSAAASDLDTVTTGKVEADEESNADDENVRQLRSGSKHPRVSVVKSIATLPANTTVTMASSNTNPQATRPIKLLPTSASIREFSGTDSNYSAREYIELCEMVMRNSSITEDGDKIAFIRARLQPGSLASWRQRGNPRSRVHTAKGWDTQLGGVLSV